MSSFARCKTNDFNGNNPIDPINLELITPENLYILNDTCYNKESVRKLLSVGNIDIYRQPIPREVYEDFGIDYPENIFEDYNGFVNAYNPITNELNLNNRGITTNFLIDFIFPNNLKILLLSNNNITSLNGINFPNQLEVIDISNNNITYSLGFGNLLIISTLKNLNLENTNFSNVNRDYIQFPDNILLLNLSNNNIRNLNYFKFNINLIELNLSNNPINFDLGLNIYNIIQLQYLNLENTYIENNYIHFPNNILRLDLSNNNITDLKNLIFNNNLQVLSLSMNPIIFSNRFILEIENILDLKALLLDNINFEFSEIQFPNNIISLSLTNCNITNLENLYFGSNLENLYLTDNPICNSGNINLLNIEVYC